MKPKLNCWQFMNCGREEGGVFADTMGVCPVSISMRHDGTNGGQAAGRVCWDISKVSPPSLMIGTGSGHSCPQCAFYKRVHFEGLDLPSLDQPMEEVESLTAEADHK